MCKKIAAVLLALVMLLSCASALAETTAQEKVYAVLDADGNVKSITDIIRLENADGLDEIADRTMLKDIENLDGPETFTLDGETLTWQAGGKDITYQGTSDKAPAVLPSVRITLDGEEVPASELKNREGDVTLTVSYQSGENMPVMAFTAMLLPEEGVSGLTTEHAIVLRELGRHVVIGWGVAGVPEGLTLPSSFSVSFHADHMELDWVMTAATSDPLSLACREIDSRIGGDLSAELTNVEKILTALKDGETLPVIVSSNAKINMTGNMLVALLNQLNDGLTKVDDGAEQLAEGAKALSEGTASLKTGADKVNEGASALQTGAAALSEGMTSAAEGAAALDTGLETLTQNNETLVSGAEQMFAGILSAANAQMAASGLAEAGLALPELTAENYGENLDQAAAALKKLSGVKTEAGEAAKQLAALKDQLDQASAFVAGVKTYTAGAAQAAEGAKTLNAGMAQLQEGAASLKTGADDLAAGTAELAGGADTAAAGAASLQTGAEQLHTSGTRTLKSSITGAETTVANLLLPYVQETLPEILSVYGQIRDQLVNTGYDLRGDDIVTKTLYIMRTDLQ